MKKFSFAEKLERAQDKERTFKELFRIERELDKIRERKAELEKKLNIGKVTII